MAAELKLEAMQLSLPSSCQLMRSLDPVVETSAVTHIYTGQDTALPHHTLQIPRDDHPHHTSQTCRKLTEDLLRHSGTVSALHQDVEHMPMLLHRGQEMVNLTSCADEDLVQVSCMARARMATLRPVGGQPAKAWSLLADDFVVDHGASSGQKWIDVWQVKAEALMQPHCMLGPQPGSESQSTFGGSVHAL